MRRSEQNPAYRLTQAGIQISPVMEKILRMENPSPNKRKPAAGESHNQGTILLIDDDKGLLRLVELSLESHGFDVVTATNGQLGLENFRIYSPDLVVLDVMMPGMDGHTVCQKLRERSTAPILFLTAQGAVEQRVNGLALGADDYLVKPFDVHELVARIEALLRRSRLTDPHKAEVLRFADGYLVINQETRQVFIDGKTLHLTPTELDLLLYLAQRPGRPLSVQTIYNSVWSYESDANPKTVRWYIWRLRKKIEPNSKEPRFIITEPGLGYRFSPV